MFSCPLHWHSSRNIIPLLFLDTRIYWNKVSLFSMTELLQYISFKFLFHWTRLLIWKKMTTEFLSKFVVISHLLSLVYWFRFATLLSSSVLFPSTHFSYYPERYSFFLSDRTVFFSGNDDLQYLLTLTTLLAMLLEIYLRNCSERTLVLLVPVLMPMVELEQTSCMLIIPGHIKIKSWDINNWDCWAETFDISVSLEVT